MLSSDLLKSIIELNNFVKKYKSKKIRLIQKDGDVYNSNFVFLYNFIVGRVLDNSPYRNIIINYLENTERHFPGSSMHLCEKLVNRFLNNKSAEFKKKSLTKESFYSFIDENCDLKYRKTIKSILEFSGPDATITCDFNNVENIVVERKDNCEFNFDIHPSLHNVLFSSKQNSKKNCTFCVADAYIERETDILPLVEHANKNRSHLVLVCRGITDIAISSIKQIMLRNNMLIYVYIEKFSHEDPFKIEDFAKSLQSTLITSDKMHSILHDGIECSSTKDNIDLSYNKISFNSQNNSLIESINESISKTNDKNLISYLNKRKKRLATKNVIVTVPKQDKNFLQTIKDIINIYNKICKFGITELEDGSFDSYASQVFTNDLSDKLYEAIKNISYTIKK